MVTTQEKQKQRHRRHRRVRARIQGSKDRPRAAVFRSHQHIYVQLIDDDTATTILAASDREIPEKERSRMNKTEIAKRVGQIIGERAKEKGINKMVFDRGGFSFHGRVKAIAEGIRDAGVSM